MRQEEGSQPDTADGAAEGAAFGSRWFELGLALLLMVAAVVVLVDARRLGTGWDEFDGPRSGYFPFYIGCLLLASAGWIALRQLLHWRSHNPDFANGEQMGRVWSIVWPMTLYVGLITWLGIYVASALLIAWFAARHGTHRWFTAAAVAIGVPLVFFIIFERYFLVALPKGPLEAALGF